MTGRTGGLSGRTGGLTGCNGGLTGCGTGCTGTNGLGGCVGIGLEVGGWGLYVPVGWNGTGLEEGGRYVAANKRDHKIILN